MANVKTKKEQDQIITQAAQAATPAPADAEPVQPKDKATGTVTPQEVFSRISAMSELVDWLQMLRILSDDELNVCEHVMALADAARAGMEFAGCKS